MALQAPVILLPSDGSDYTTDTVTQTISGTTSTNTARMTVNGSTSGLSYTPGESIWSWTGDIASGVNTFSFIAIEKTTGDPSPAAEITVTLVQLPNFITVSPPTGTRLRESQDQIEVICTQNPEAQTVGYNFYVSTESGGVSGGYVKINPQTITDYSFYEDAVKEVKKTTDTAGNIRVVTITEEIVRLYFYSVYFTSDIFNAMVTAGLLPDTTFSKDTSFFFVASAVIYDPALGQVTESAYSIELEGSPFTITTGIQDLPSRTQSDILLTMSQELLTGNAGVDTKPGTVVRDILDPITEEMARVYVIQDFLSRSLSVSALLDFDDSDGDGVSDPVSNSVKKQALGIALGLPTDDAIQQLIDDQFEKLGSNVNVTRQGSTSSVGQVVYFTETPPLRDMTVVEGAAVTSPGDMDQGIPAQTFTTLTTKTLDYTNRETYYNNTTKRYELSLDVEALIPGSEGNVDAYAINTASNGSDADFRVENPNPISFGADRESNHDMASRIMLAFFADTGTEGGYVKIAAAVPGVRNVRVEKAGDPLMIRDFDPIRNEHIGGKVDIYIQGTRSKQVSDQIAFSFGSVSGTLGSQSGEAFLVISAVSFQFRSQNPRVTAHTPIFEVSRVYNSTKGADYDLTGYQIIGDGNTIELDETRPANQTIGLASTDIIKVDYKYRSSDTFIMETQPILTVVSVVGQISGELPRDNYELVSLQDPLDDGGSTIAQDGVRIKFANNLPLTEFQTVVDEEHILITNVEEPLNLLGIDPESIVVRNSDKTIVYVTNVDYTIILGTDVSPTSIKMIDSGRIQSGQAVLVNYIAIENFVITYTTNGLLGTTQDQVNKTKHACADAIVKQSIQNDIDMVITVIPKTSANNLTTLSAGIKTVVANYVNQLGVGVGLTQSEVVNLIQKVPDVDYVSLPFLKMIKEDGSFIVRDPLSDVPFEIFNQGITTAYVTTIPALTYSTVDKGGSENLFRGVFEDTMPLILQSDPLEVSAGSGRAYIKEDGRIIVSTKDGALPDTKKYEVAYYTYSESGSKDIQVASVEYLMVGNFTIIFDNPRSQSKQAF